MILLFSWEQKTPFSQACSLLSPLEEPGLRGRLHLALYVLMRCQGPSRPEKSYTDWDSSKHLSFMRSRCMRAGGEQAESSQRKLRVSWTHPCIPTGTRKSGKKACPFLRLHKPIVPIDPKTVPTRTQNGKVNTPAPVLVRQLRDYYANAFSKFIALTSATLKVHVLRL
ncbi:hypothetical protein EVAR_34645_1 [Eumeta japonica]|uniref:Uncharacterized protein n=1 Tax=Eumeta variegata TaxID=151549 RepID=A0A4C1VER0_EUMVA|nr:hypothetical protein EVAR_34645_1 [Eumeta japonica]